MFLTENYVENNEVNADPVYAMQIMQEATDDWNDICMKMIKLEHTAIMREDSELLAEGAREALTRFKNNIVVLGRKLIEYLERVRVQWSKLQASITSKYVNTQAVQLIMDQVNGIGGSKGKYKVSIPKNWSDVKTVVESMSKASGTIAEAIINSLGNKAKVNNTIARMDKLSSDSKYKALSDSDDDVEEKIAKILFNNSFKPYEGEYQVDVTKDLVVSALNFLKKRPAAIKNIETMKKAVTQVMNAQIHEMDKEEKPEARNFLVALQRAFNQIIIKINKSTTIAVKICNVVKGQKGYTGIDSKVKNKAFDDARGSKGVYRVDNEGHVKNESLLDLF